MAGILLLAIPVSGARGESRPFTLVIDAGHGGHDVGAVDNGAREKDINLGVATRLKRLVEKNLRGVKVVMTRDGDTFVSLQERAEIANRNHGNLFLSIHTNSVDKSNRNRTNVAGASVYALGLHKDDNNLRVARRENSVIELESDYKQKYSGFDPSKDESYIIFEMAQKKNLGQSLKFASMAQKQLVGNAGRVDRGVKQAGFWVLWATSMPSVLVELDFICNPACAKFLNSDAGRDKLAESLYNAVENYVEHYNRGNAIVSGEKAEWKKGADGPSAPPKTAATSKNEKKTVTGGEPGTGSSRKKDKKSDSRRNKKKKKKSTTKDKPVAEIPAAVNDSSADDDIPLLASAGRPRSKRDDKVPVVADSPRQYRAGGARRRRSTAARKISDSRVVEAESILLLSENCPKSDNIFAATNAAPDNSKETLTAAAGTGSETAAASRRDKVKESLTKSEKEKADRKKEKKARPESKGQKRFVVKNTAAALASAGETSSGFKVRNDKIKTVYKIQVLASSDRLMENNPQFCGLKPIKAFKENNLYKYTYGESENRREIENMLLDVKSKIPDAFIIISKK